MGDAAEVIPLKYVSPLEEREENLKPYSFWKKVGNNYDFDTIILLNLLEHLGFKRVILNERTENESKEVVLINEYRKTITTYKNDKTALEAIKEEIHKFWNNNTAFFKLKKIPLEKIRDNFNKKNRNFLSLDIFLMKPAKSISDFKFIKPDKDHGYYFFHNCIAEVSKNSRNAYDYFNHLRPEHLKDKYVWASEIKEDTFHVLNEVEYSKDTFFDFLHRLTYDESKELENDDENSISDFQKLCSAIGYLCHNYKDFSVPKIVIITEANPTDEAKGGTGKGIIMQGIGKLVKVTPIDGKTFDPKNRFRFARVTNSTKVVYINDPTRYLPAESFYNAASDSFEIERKGKDAESINFEVSPKIAVTTNFDLRGNSDSDNRRKHYVVLIPFFSKNIQPRDFYGENIFDNWETDKIGKNRVYNILLMCVQAHLKYELPEFNSEILITKRIQQEVGGKDVYDWLESLPKNTIVEFSYFEQDYAEKFGTKANQAKIGKILRVYCNWKGFEYREQRRHGEKRGYGIYENRGTTANSTVD